VRRWAKLGVLKVFAPSLHCKENFAAAIAKLRSPLTKVIVLEYVLSCALGFFLKTARFRLLFTKFSNFKLAYIKRSSRAGAREILERHKSPQGFKSNSPPLLQWRSST